MSDKVEVKSIVIAIGDKTITLSLDEARELHGQLQTLFVKVAPPPYPITYPVIIERDRWPRWWEPPFVYSTKVTCNTEPVSVFLSTNVCT